MFCRHIRHTCRLLRHNDLEWESEIEGNTASKDATHRGRHPRLRYGQLRHTYCRSTGRPRKTPFVDSRACLASDRFGHRGCSPTSRLFHDLRRQFNFIILVPRLRLWSHFAFTCSCPSSCPCFRQRLADSSILAARHALIRPKCIRINAGFAPSPHLPLSPSRHGPTRTTWFFSSSNSTFGVTSVSETPNAMIVTRSPALMRWAAPPLIRILPGPGLPSST